MADPGDGPIVHRDLGSLTTEAQDITDDRDLAVYDGQVGLRLLYEEAGGGEEHYLVRYPAGLSARWHGHSAAHTIVGLEGQLSVNGRVIGPGAYCHFPAGVPMHHAPADDAPCAFLILFHGPSDVEVLDEPPV